MTECVIGFDTSCYTTSCAAVTMDGQVIASCRKLLPVKLGQRGLRQSEAVFDHVRQLPPLMQELGEAIREYQVAAVCASFTPRDDEDSYMPVFHVGATQAQGLSALMHVPLYKTTHQRGHIAAASLDSGIQPGDLLALHLSGGTTELLEMKDGRLTIIGGTRDLHAGQLVDRTGVALGLPFPSGPHLEELAVKGNAQARIGVSMVDGTYCHFSGAEAQLMRLIQSGEIFREDIAAEVYDLLARTIARMVTRGAEQTGIRQVLLAGGVASSALFREKVRGRISKIDRELSVCFGHPQYSGDNAVGVALEGARQARNSTEVPIVGSADS